MNLKKLMKIKDGYNADAFRKNVAKAIAEPYEEYKYVEENGKYIRKRITGTLKEGDMIDVEYKPYVSSSFYVEDELADKIARKISEYDEFLGEHLVSIKRHSDEFYKKYDPVFDEEGQAVWEELREDYARGVTGYYASKRSGDYTGD